MKSEKPGVYKPGMRMKKGEGMENVVVRLGRTNGKRSSSSSSILRNRYRVAWLLPGLRPTRVWYIYIYM